MTLGTYETIRAPLMRACSGPHFSKLKSLIEQKRNSQFGGWGGSWDCMKNSGAVWFAGLLFLLGSALVMYEGSLSAGPCSSVMHYSNKSSVIHHLQQLLAQPGASNQN